MKNRFFSLILVLILALSLALPGAAEILYDDPFDEINTDFWVREGSHFDIDEERLDGWDDAVIQQSKSDWNNPAPGAFIEYTAWVDVFIEPSAAVDPYTAGIWYTNICSYLTGYLNSVERYKLHYNCEDSTVYLIIETDRRIKNLGEDCVLGSLKLENGPGANYDGDPVRLGLRVESGKLTAYANGKVVCEHSYEFIGKYYSAMILCNNGCHAAFDNFAVGDLDEDVAVRTRPYDYVPESYTVTVDGGTTSLSEALEGESVTVSARTTPGTTFDCWELIAGEGIGEEQLREPEFTFVMGKSDVELRAKFKSAYNPYDLICDINADGKTNAKDVTALMKYLVGAPPKTFVEAAADFDGNGKINAKDVTGLMKMLVNS